MSEVTIRDYIDSRLNESEKRWLDRFDSVRREVDTATAALDYRLAGMNEFRDAMKDQATRMATKSELVTIDENVRELQRVRVYLTGVAAGAGAVFGMLSSLIVQWMLQ